MIYLLIAIVFSAMIPLLFHLGHQKEMKESLVITMNYLMAITISGSLLFLSDKQAVEAKVTLAGVVTGACYYLAFFFYQRSVRLSGASLAAAFSKMGILVPILFSFAIWREWPTLNQGIGILVALYAMATLRASREEEETRLSLHPALFFLLLLGGLGDFGNKVYQELALTTSKTMFLLVVFTSAFILSLRKEFFSLINYKREIIFGIMIGVPNLFTAFFLIEALKTMPAPLVYPMYSGMTIIVTSLVSVVAFGERLNRKEWYRLSLIIISIVLLNI